MRKLEKQSLENVRDHVRKISFVKQNDDKTEIPSQPIHVAETNEEEESEY